jgi:predicted PurR-regulated permease PerM
LSTPESTLAPVSPQPPRFRNVVQVGILTLLVLYTLYFASPLVIPLVLALLFTFMLMPVVRALGRAGLPPVAAAAVIVLVALAALGAGLYSLAEPATGWMQRATMIEIRYKLGTLIQPIEDVRRATEEVEQIAGREDDDTERVVVRETTLGEILLTGTGRLIASGAIVLVLVFFLLTTGERVGQDFVRTLPRLGYRKRALRIGRAVEREVQLRRIALISNVFYLAHEAGVEFARAYQIQEGCGWIDPRHH